MQEAAGASGLVETSFGKSSGSRLRGIAAGSRRLGPVGMVMQGCRLGPGPTSCRSCGWVCWSFYLGAGPPILDAEAGGDATSSSGSWPGVLVVARTALRGSDELPLRWGPRACLGGLRVPVPPEKRQQRSAGQRAAFTGPGRRQQSSLPGAREHRLVGLVGVVLSLCIRDAERWSSGHAAGSTGSQRQMVPPRHEASGYSA